MKTTKKQLFVVIMLCILWFLAVSLADNTGASIISSLVAGIVAGTCWQLYKITNR